MDGGSFPSVRLSRKDGQGGACILHDQAAQGQVALFIGKPFHHVQHAHRMFALGPDPEDECDQQGAGYRQCDPHAQRQSFVVPGQTVRESQYLHGFNEKPERDNDQARQEPGYHAQDRQQGQRIRS